MNDPLSADDAASPDLTGRMFHRYRILSKLGEGRTGSVWLAEDSFLRRNLAIKLLRKGTEVSPQASSLRHPGIATVYDVGEEDGITFVASQLIEGETLAERLKRGLLPWEEAVQLVRDAAEALAYAHDRGVYHRHVSSRTIMVRPDGAGVLVDFGLVPEAIPGGRAGTRSDLDGLGVVLREMATGSSWRLPAALDRIVAKVSANDPESRYESARELAEDLEPFVRSAPLRRKRRLAGRYRVAGALLLALGIIVVAERSGLLRSSEPRIKYASVGVLPLAHSGDDPGEATLLAHGISETVAAKLTGLEGLRVSPWVTSQRYSTETLSPGLICQELNVEAIVTGEFQLAGDVISGSVELTEGVEGKVVWSEHFDEPVADVLRVQGKIAVELARALRGELGGIDRAELARPVANSVEAYQHYLRGSAKLHEQTVEANAQALVHFERARELDPTLAAAHVGIGAVRADRAFLGWEDKFRNLKLAEQSFRAALDIDPDNHRALRGLASVFWATSRNLECLELARELDETSVEESLTRAVAYLRGGLASESLPLFRRALESDPANEGAWWTLVWACAFAGRFEETLEAGESFLRRFDEDPEVHLWMNVASEHLGRLERARAHLDRAVEISTPESDRTGDFLGVFLLDHGEPERGRQVLRDYLDATATLDQPGLRAIIHALLGEPEACLRSVHRPDSRYSLRLESLVLAYFRLGDHKSARREVEQALKRGWVPESVFHLKTTSTAGCRELFERPENADLRRRYEEQLARLRREYGRDSSSKAPH